MKPGRNEVCSCGSGEKYKRCCGKGVDAPETRRASAAPMIDAGHLALMLRAGRYRDVERLARQSLAGHPGTGYLWKCLGLAQRRLGVDARQALYWATRYSPDDAEAHCELGSALLDAAQSEAEPCFRRAVELAPGCAEAHAGLSRLLKIQGRAVEAEASCRRALQLLPRDAGSHALLGDIQADQGLFADAQASFERARDLDPSLPDAWVGIARYRKMSRDDETWRRSVQGLLGRSLPPRQEAALQFAMGKYHDDLGEFATAFACYRRANDLSRVAGPSYDRGQMVLFVDRLIQAFDGGWFTRMRRLDQASCRPTFIVGMPRSGTSLVEQIVASHPRASGAGELAYWNDASIQHVMSALDGSLTANTLDELGEQYLSLLDRAFPGAERVTDKMPANFFNLGLIHAALPQARIVHVTRHPIDTCLSIYFQNFAGTHAYAADLGDLAHYYQAYSRLMRHWRETLPPGTLMELPYEALIDRQEWWTRRLLDFIALEWDARCLAFHRTARTVSTSSKWQVRQEINRSSAGRWQNYASFVGPLRGLIQSAGALA